MTTTEAKTTHTPGPWRQDSNGDGTHCITAGRGSDVADTRSAVNEKANALLIAAAPDLLSACEQMQAFITVMCGRGDDAVIPETIRTPLGVDVKVGEIIRDASTAIAKATGA